MGEGSRVISKSQVTQIFDEIRSYKLFHGSFQWVRYGVWLSGAAYLVRYGLKYFK